MAQGTGFTPQGVPQLTQGSTLMTQGMGAANPGSGITGQIQHPSNATINYAFVVRRLTTG